MRNALLLGWVVLQGILVCVFDETNSDYSITDSLLLGDLEDIDNRFDKTSNVARQKCMLELAEDGLYLAQRSVATQERICTAGRFALSFKTAISSALELSPCASLAWVGLCSILPVGFFQLANV